MKWVLRGIAFVLLVFISAFTIKAISGRHVDLLGIEMNIPEQKKADTIRIVNTLPADTVYIPKPTTAKEIDGVIPVKQPPKTVEQKNNNGDNNYVGGDNKGVVGGKDNTVNNYGLIPRIIEEKDFLPVLKYFPNKNMEVRFLAFGGVDSEISAVKDQITGYFKKYGYNNIERTFDVSIGEVPPSLIRFDSVPGENKLIIKIPPMKQ